VIAFAALVALYPLANAATFSELQAAHPDLFDADTGFRIAEQRAETPEDIPPPSVPVDANKAQQILESGALAIDVLGAAEQRYDELDGSWPVNTPRLSLPGATWLPEVGRGSLTDIMQHYFEDNLQELTDGDKARQLLFFCVDNCWMSWNAAQRAASMGYSEVYWFREGTDGWTALDLPLEPVDPVPVNVD